MRKPRDFRPEQLYAVTQRGNGGQWIYRDPQDFEQALAYMRKYTALHKVRIHGYCLLHNHSHWIFEASTPQSISNVMRDAQSRYSHYLNVKYRETPWVLIAPLYGVKDIDHFAPYLRTGPVNWTPRFDARHLDAKGFREFLRYIENNPVAAVWPIAPSIGRGRAHKPTALAMTPTTYSPSTIGSISSATPQPS